MRKAAVIFILMWLFSLPSYAQSQITRDFKEPCDSLNILLQERTGVKGELKLNSVMRRGSVLDFYFNESLGDFP